jgi:ketosteroid isomerase-like protein
MTILLRPLALALAVFALAGCATTASSPADLELRAAEVRASEQAFAQTMAERNFLAFGAFIAEDAVFVNSGRPLRGKPAILAHWKRFFDAPSAPFSWKPEVAEVTRSGDLGYTTGPVTAAGGALTAHFHSTWRRDASGRWQIVFDNGYPACNCPR